MTNGEKHIEKLLSWYKEAVTEDGVCYLTSDDKNTLTYAIKCCKQNDLGVDCISREEAIDIIKCLAWHTRPDEDDIEQAIKVLEQESSNSGKPNDSTTKNDLGVDWDELKRKIFMEVDGGTDDKWLRYVDVCENISKSIDEFKADLPQATPIRPKGHWIKGYTYPDGEYWKCDKCNELIKVKYPMHYCNNCGSDNREVEE